MKRYLNSSTVCATLLTILFLTGLQAFTNEKYKGKAWKDSIQAIPGKVQCEFYDQGGEGIAFHDSDTTNSGSGGLNPADGTYLNEFRMHEPVDISYTKFRDPAIDNNLYNFIEPVKNQLYVGWTSPGEWTKYTVKVTKAGTYQVGIMYTSNQNGKISVSVNDKDETGPLLIPSTAVAAETVPWRQWHHWNYIGQIARIDLKAGIQTITLHTVDIGQMNYDYLNFILVN